MFSGISRVLFIGGNRFNEDGPLLKFISICQDRSINTFVLTDKERVTYPSASMGTLGECLVENGIDFLAIERLTIELLKQYQDESTLVFCVNCKWILSQEMIDLFPGRIFNYHNSALPEQRGAACHSWRLMQGIDFTRLSIHEIVTGIDRGRIYAQDTLTFNNSIHNLKQTYRFIAPRETKLFEHFIDGDISIVNQREQVSFYWPRLSTPVHGYIDWSWTASEIVSFCAAFDDPFDGASTFLFDSRAYFCNVKQVKERFSFHPFQSGLIYRIDDSGIFISARGGGVCVNNIRLDHERQLRVGLRFVTPPDVLFSALTASV